MQTYGRDTGPEMTIQVNNVLEYTLQGKFNMSQADAMKLIGDMFSLYPTIGHAQSAQAVFDACAKPH